MMESKQSASASEDSEFDEDVILPNSPLSSYIQELEIEKENKLNFIENSFESAGFEILRHNYVPETSHSSVETPYVEVLKMYLNSFCNYTISFCTTVDSFLSNCILACVKNFGILVDEDVTFLNNWILNSADPTNVITLRRTSFLLLSAVMFNFIIWRYVFDVDLWNGSLFSTLHLFCIAFKNSLPIYALLYFVIPIVILLFITLNLIKIIHLIVLYFQLQSVLNTTKKTVVLIKKNIRLIQEAELTSRGFTSTSHSLIAERIEISKNLPIITTHRHHPALRKSLFIWTKKLFLNFRLATLKLIQTMQLGPDFDFSSHSLAMLDLKEFGNLMQLDLDSNKDLEELLKITDNFSISSLRTVFSLMELQISEYFKYLYLTLSFAKPNRRCQNGNYLIILFQLLRSLMLCQNNSIFSKVSEAYRYYRCIEASCITQPTSKPEACQHFALQIDLHNMSLHLKAALIRLQEAEEFLSTRKSSDAMNSDTCFKNVKKLIDQVNGEIQAFNESFCAYNMQLQTILCGSKSETPNVMAPQLEQSDLTAVIKAVVKCDVEQELKDEVFEDIVTKSISEDNGSKENVDFEIKRNTEMASCLMHELKNVLVVKADEHRLREEKALALKIPSSGSYLKEENEQNTKTSTIVHDLTPKSDINILTPRIKELDETQLNCINSEQNSIGKNNFAASIAALANQRKLILGVSTDECFIGDSSDSADEDTKISN